MDLQIFQIPKMSFQTPSGWESAKARGPWQALPNSHSRAAWAGGLGSSSQIWGPLGEEGGWLLGPFLWSQAAAQASSLSPSFLNMNLIPSVSLPGRRCL